MIKGQSEELGSLVIYRNLLNDEVFMSLMNFYNSENETMDYGVFANTLLKKTGNNNLGQYIADSILYDTNVFSRKCVSGEQIKSWLLDGVKRELSILQKILKSNICEFENILKLDFKYKSPALNENWEECVLDLAQFYKNSGDGDFARHDFFIWNNGVVPVKHPERVDIKKLYGYERERQIVIDNTKRLLEGKSANNILLYGDRGTGKSATVKAIANEYKDLGLRLLEVKKEYLDDIDNIFEFIFESKMRFIIFIDDLSFDNHSMEFAKLKTVLDGGIRKMPGNCVIYATTNRRHMIKETFSDRVGFSSADANQEVRAKDSLEETLSLSDRFGITITFSSPDKNTYLAIVDAIADERGITMPKEELHRLALIWEMRYNGRSPRTAKQFVLSL